jgi:hypothetical protein
MAGYFSYFLGWTTDSFDDVNENSIEYIEFIKRMPYGNLLHLVIEELNNKFKNDVRYYNIKQIACDITGNIQKYMFLNKEQTEKTLDFTRFIPIRVKKGLIFSLKIPISVT